MEDFLLNWGFIYLLTLCLVFSLPRTALVRGIVVGFKLFLLLI